MIDSNFVVNVLTEIIIWQLTMIIGKWFKIESVIVKVNPKAEEPLNIKTHDQMTRLSSLKKEKKSRIQDSKIYVYYV